MKKFLFVVIYLITVSGVSLMAQPSVDLAQFEGYWEGAFIKGNSYQKIEIHFYQREGKLLSLQIMEEWHPSFGEFEVPVEIDSTGKISLNTGYGKVFLDFDKNNLEILGQIQNSNPAIYLHLKKSPPPPEDLYEVDEIQFQNGNVTLFGHLHQAKLNFENTAVIIVGGRGCYAGSTKHDLYAKFFRKYGISTLVYNKRGTGQSGGDCSQATIADLAMDLKAAKEFLANHPSDFEKIGVLGTSAGGWVMTRAQEETSFDFMISIVGPSTSVRDQQLQSMDYGAEFYGLSETAKNNLEEYTKMMFDAPDNKKSQARFDELLGKADEEGWKDLLDDTDRPEVTGGINNLWVRRHDYDPGKSLASFDAPFLAIYGERDWIVPPKENIDKLSQLFSGERSKWLNSFTAYDAEHGMEMQQRYIDLAGGKSYWHFYRISPILRIEILKFLRKYALISG